VTVRTPPSRPRVVFLDVGDTLVRAHPSWAGVYRLGLADMGLEIDEDELGRALAEATTSGSWPIEGPFETTEEASFARVVEFDRRVLAALGHDDLPDEVFRRIETAFMERTAWYIFPDVPPAIDALTAAGIRLGVISNWVWGGPELLHSLELAGHFEALTISARVGYNKPHPRIFEHALHVMNVAPSEAVHVGDSYSADVVGARAVGIAPVLIDRRVADPARVRAEHEDPELPVVRDLLELLDLLGIERPARAVAAAGVEAGASA
jgi:putative hydrolase of the HAD superfamily